MAFKIVQTIEYDVPKLTIVPMLWESNGILRWPPKNNKFASKLIKDGHSRPGPEWNSYKCVLKRNYIPTYEEADMELRRMEQNTNSDEINFDALEQDLTQLDDPQPSANDRRGLATKVFCQEQDTIQVFNSEDIRTVIANQAKMLEKLNVVVENQKKIAHKLVSLTKQLEETKASISQEKERPLNITLLQDQFSTEEENESFSIKAVENQQQLEMLETDLADKAKKKKLSKALSLLCSSKQGSGTTCAYKLLDTLFTKNFLCQCSWSGGSKGDTSKIPFKEYKNVRNFFFEIVNSWDSNFTDEDAEKFLKVVLRNATKRKLMKGIRQSSKRTRKSKNREVEIHNFASNDSDELQAEDEDNGGEDNGDNIEQTRGDESMDIR